MTKVRIWLISVIVIAMMISTTSALPEILDVFNTNYNTTGTRLDTCDTCHIPGQLNTNLNPYGVDVKSHLNIPINKALAVIEPLDSDGDGFTNIDEISNLTFPGNKSDFLKMNAVIRPNIIIHKNGFPKTNTVASANSMTNRTTDNNENNVTVTNPDNMTNRTTDNNENNITFATITNLVPTVTVTMPATQKAPGFGIFASILLLFILSRYRKY